MCCLTIYQDKDGRTIFTHNRDESILRSTASAEIVKDKKNEKIAYYPVDAVSKGTWVGFTSCRVAALLNGWNRKHLRKSSYPFSRGILIPDLLKQDSALQWVEDIDLVGGEPFTLVFFDSKEGLWQLGWDGNNKHLIALNISSPLIFSSYTLYNEDVQNSRKLIWSSFISSNPTANKIWNLHNLFGDDHGSFFRVSVNEFIQTVSISQIIIGDGITMKNVSFSQPSLSEPSIVHIDNNMFYTKHNV